MRHLATVLVFLMNSRSFFVGLDFELRASLKLGNSLRIMSLAMVSFSSGFSHKTAPILPSACVSQFSLCLHTVGKT
jgi:hypothetical protein